MGVAIVIDCNLRALRRPIDVFDPLGGLPAGAVGIEAIGPDATPVVPVLTPDDERVSGLVDSDAGSPGIRVFVGVFVAWLDEPGVVPGVYRLA